MGMTSNLGHSHNAKGVNIMNPFNAIHSAHIALKFDDKDIRMLIDSGFAYTHIIGAALANNADISDRDLLKIAKCIIGNVNYRNHVPTKDNDNIIDTIDSITDKYINNVDCKYSDIL